jgi:DNA-binding response OmpR family regulator
MAAKRPLRILVVDDCADATDMLALLLQMAGYEVLRSYTGADALEKTVAYEVEVVILDLAMPEVDGYEVAQQIRQREHGKEVLIIAVTGFADDAHRQRANEVGFDHYFVKPVDFAVLRDVVEGHQSTRQMGSSQ